MCTVLTPEEVNQRFAEVEKGKNTEDRFFSLLMAKETEWPDWMWGIRRATPLEDSEGVDAFIDTASFPWVPVQIKSSHAGLEKHEDRYGNRHVILTIFKEISDEGIMERMKRDIEKYVKRYGTRAEQ